MLITTTTCDDDSVVETNKLEGGDVSIALFRMLDGGASIINSMQLKGKHFKHVLRWREGGGFSGV